MGLRQKDQGFEMSLGYIARYCLKKKKKKDSQQGMLSEICQSSKAKTKTNKKYQLLHRFTCQILRPETEKKLQVYLCKHKYTQ
jgi:hypothetical protein